MPVRASALNEAELCGLAPVIAHQRNASGRKALIGTAFHGWCDDPKGAETEKKMARLTPDERHELAQWKRPSAYPFPFTEIELRYEDAVRETPVGLGVNGGYVKVTRGIDGSYGCPTSDPVLVPATPDMVWYRDDWTKGGIVFVGDIKTGALPIPGGTLSLQFVAPALALADLHGADWIRTGIWWAREGRWEWHPEAIAVDSDLAVELWTRIRSAATNPPEAVTGPHCSDCWQRAHCPAFTLPVSQAETELAPLTKPGGLTADNAVRAFLVLQAMGKLVETGRETVRAFLREHGDVPATGGKKLTLQSMAGREYADIEELKSQGLARFVKKGRDSSFPAIRNA